MYTSALLPPLPPPTRRQPSPLARDRLPQCFIALFLFFVLFGGHSKEDSSAGSGSSSSSSARRGSRGSKSPASRTTAAAADGGSGGGGSGGKQKPVAGEPGAAQPKMVTYRVVKEVPHDPSAFLQGLQFERRCDASHKCRCAGQAGMRQSATGRCLLRVTTIWVAGCCSPSA